MRLILLLSAAIAAAVTTTVNAETLAPGQVLRLMDKWHTIPHEKEDEMIPIVDKDITDTFVGMNYTEGLTGDGYGGPCAIIDGFYKGGVPVVENGYSFFRPEESNLAEATVIEYSFCDNGEYDFYYPTFVITLYDDNASDEFIKALVDDCGFTLSTKEDDERHSVFTNGTYNVELYDMQADEENYYPRYDCHTFIFGTIIR